MVKLKIKDSLKKGLSSTVKTAKSFDSKKWGNRLAKAGEIGGNVSRGIMGDATVNPDGFGGVADFAGPSGLSDDFVINTSKRRADKVKRRRKSQRGGDIHVHVYSSRRRRK